MKNPSEAVPSTTPPATPEVTAVPKPEPTRDDLLLACLGNVTQGIRHIDGTAPHARFSRPECATICLLRAVGALACAMRAPVQQAPKQ